MKNIFHTLISAFIVFFIQSQQILAESNFKFNNSNDNIKDQIWSRYWNSNDGLDLLNKSQYNGDFYRLINFYQPQINPLYCSAATSAIILNALHYGNIQNQAASQTTLPIELGGGFKEFPLYTQEYFFNNKTDNIKNRHIINLEAPKEIKYRRKVYDPGVNLADLNKILTEIYDLEVTINYADKITEEALNNFRQTIREILADDKRYLIVNFDGRILGKKTHGHTSPLVAFNEKEDAILVLDVALHKNRWY